MKVNIDILCVSETWYNETHLNADVNIPGYSLFRKDRDSKKTGGGVAIYSKETINTKARYDLPTDKQLEMVWLELPTKGNAANILLCCCYRPPNSDEFYDMSILDTFEKAQSEEKHIEILGDMNYDYDIDDRSYTNPISKIESLFSLSQLIQTPTREVNGSSSLLDIILTSCPNNH